MSSRIAETLYPGIPGSKWQIAHGMPNVYSEDQKALFAHEASAGKARVSSVFDRYLLQDFAKKLIAVIDCRRSWRKLR